MYIYTLKGLKVTNLLQYVLQTGKKFVYVEPPKRVKEVLEEELYFRRDGCQIKHPAAVALEGIWSVKRNFSMGDLKPAPQNRNSLLSQPKYYSRHGGIKSKS
uniref:Chromosome 11 open reading frame 97 n=1 Tax=Pelusios castaneus TaxID=367368 RepID=A0A8C8SZ06_9SAUR